MINNTGGRLLFPSLLSVALKLREHLVPFEQERKLREKEIHLVTIEILGKSLLSFHTSKMKIKSLWACCNWNSCQHSSFLLKAAAYSFIASVFLSL